MISKHTEVLIDNVGTTLLSRMAVDQEPHRVKTMSLDMVLNRLSPSLLETNTGFEDEDVGFKLPFKAITDEKAKDAQFVDTLVIGHDFFVYINLNRMFAAKEQECSAPEEGAHENDGDARRKVSKNTLKDTRI